MARGHELHRICRKIDARAHAYRAGHVHGNAARGGRLAEKRASGGTLRYVGVAEDAEPGLCLGKMLDHIRTSEAGHDYWLPKGQHAMYRRGLLFRQGHAAFAVGHAHKKRQNYGVAGGEFREFEAADGREPSIKLQSFERIHTPADFVFQKSSRVNIRITGDTQEQ